MAMLQPKFKRQPLWTLQGPLLKIMFVLNSIFLVDMTQVTVIGWPQCGMVYFVFCKIKQWAFNLLVWMAVRFGKDSLSSSIFYHRCSDQALMIRWPTASHICFQTFSSTLIHVVESKTHKHAWWSSWFSPGMRYLVANLDRLERQGEEWNYRYPCCYEGFYYRRLFACSVAWILAGLTFFLP